MAILKIVTDNSSVGAISRSRPPIASKTRSYRRRAMKGSLPQSLFAHLISLDRYHKPNRIHPICVILGCNDYKSS